MKTIEISDELNKYIDDIIELLDDEHETFEDVIWSLITVTNITKQDRYPIEENPIYG